MTAAAGRRYTEDEQARRMLVLALNGGSVSQAKKQLDGEGFNVSVSTLIRWKDAPLPRASRDGEQAG